MNIIYYNNNKYMTDSLFISFSANNSLIIKEIRKYLESI